MTSPSNKIVNSDETSKRQNSFKKNTNVPEVAISISAAVHIVPATLVSITAKYSNYSV